MTRESVQHPKTYRKTQPAISNYHIKGIFCSQLFPIFYKSVPLYFLIISLALSRQTTKNSYPNSSRQFIFFTNSPSKLACSNLQKKTTEYRSKYSLLVKIWYARKNSRHSLFSCSKLIVEDIKKSSFYRTYHEQY